MSWHWRVYDAKFKGQLTCGLKNDIRNLESLHFDVLLFSIAYKVSTKKSIKELSLLTLKKDLNFEENCLFVWKMTSEILWTLTWAVESLKICTLMDYFCRKYVMFELKRYRGVVLWKMTYGFKNDISNLVNFHTSSWK